MSDAAITPKPELLTPAQARQLLPALVALLQDAVNGGASIGFLRPLAADIAERYWTEIIHDVSHGARLLFVLREGSSVVGSIQLGLCTRPNGLHRAEVQKLMVRSASRRRGFGRLLMTSVEIAARTAKRTLLYLDTEPDQPAEEMYRRLGWTRSGSIPDYACTPDGTLHPTVIYYKKLTP